LRPAVFILLSAAGCGSSKTSTECLTADVQGPQLLLRDPTDPNSKLEGRDGFFAHPWPSDARKKADGHLRLDGFPNPTESSTLDEYLHTIGDETVGYGRNAAVYMSFSGPLDGRTLPQTPLAAATATASVYLVDVDPASPARGKRW